MASGRHPQPGFPAAISVTVPASRAVALLACLASAAVLLSPVTALAATTYKWVDENGITHYTDKMPAEQINKSRVELDKQARPMKKVEPAPTPEQIRAKQVEAERQQVLAREQEALLRRDRALMSSYTSEGEIDLARNRVVATIDGQMQSAQGYSQQLAKREAELLAKKTRLGDKALPVADERELEAVQAELAKQQALLGLKQRERDAAVAKYDADKARWRELRTLAEANSAMEAARATAADAAPRKPSTSGPK